MSQFWGHISGREGNLIKTWLSEKYISFFFFSDDKLISLSQRLVRYISLMWKNMRTCIMTIIGFYMVLNIGMFSNTIC